MVVSKVELTRFALVPKGTWLKVKWSRQGLLRRKPGHLTLSSLPFHQAPTFSSLFQITGTAGHWHLRDAS